MITACIRRQADSIPILCITGQPPARACTRKIPGGRYRVDLQAGTKWSVTVREPALVPRAFQQAFHLMRSGPSRPVLIDLPFDVQMAEIEFDPDTYQPLPLYKPTANRKQIDKRWHVVRRRTSADRGRGGIINAMPRTSWWSSLKLPVCR